MKELSTEQKAKAYDLAIDAAKKYHNGTLKDVMETIFPELKESEGEKIRKELKHYLEVRRCQTNDDEEYIDCNRFLAWLEKRGEETEPQTNERAWLYLVSDVLTWKDGIGQYLDDPRVQELAKKLCSEYAQKLYNPSVLSHSSNTGNNNNQEPADNVEPKFNEGDWVVHTATGITHQIKYLKKDVASKTYGYSLFDGGYISCYDEANYHLWNIKDAKSGDVLFMDNGAAKCVFIYKSYNNGIINKYASYDNFGFEGEHYLVLNDGYVIPATKEQRDTLMKAMTDAGYEWDTVKKELRKLSHSEVTKTSDQVQKPAECRQEIKPNGGIVYEDFNEGDSSYKVNLAYLSKPQVELIENLVASWQNITNNTAEWSKEDDINLGKAIWYVENPAPMIVKDSMLVEWLKSLKQRIGE